MVKVIEVYQKPNMKDSNTQMKGIIRSKGSERHSTNFIFSYFYTGLQIRK